MSTSQTIINYANAFKWPVVVTGVIAYFHKPLHGILDRISKAQKGALTGPAGTGLSWDDTLKEVDEAVAEASPESRLPPNATPDEEEWLDVIDLIPVNPGAAVLLAYTQVEVALRELAEQRGVGDAHRMGAAQLARILDVPPSTVEALAKLGALRNNVAHLNAKPDPDTADEYVNSAWRLYELLRDAAGA